MNITEDSISLAAEVEKGNLEYKRQLHNLTDDRIVQLATQMNWRINEGLLTVGKEEAIYMIGVEDNGQISGLESDILLDSLNSLEKIATYCRAKIKSTEIITNRYGMIARVIVERDQQSNILESSVFILGKQGSGKTTLISVLKDGRRDDGAGLLRDQIMKHPHELEAGETSSINYHLIGFKDMKLINYGVADGSWKNIVRRSDRVMTLIDFPGNYTHINTCLFGLMSHKVAFSFILIDALTIEIDAMTQSMLDWGFRFNMKFAIVITKVELVTKEQLKSLLYLINNYVFSSYQHSIKVINKIDDVEMIPLHTNKIPVFYISNVTHLGINLITHALSLIESEEHELTTSGKEFIINNVTNVPDLGIVITGRVSSGTINVGDKLIIGQVKNRYVEIVVQSIHHNYIPVKILKVGSTGSLVINNPNEYVFTKKMIIISSNLFTNFVNKFMIIFDTPVNWIHLDSQYNMFTGNQMEPFIVKEITYIEGKICIISQFIDQSIYRYIKHGDPIVVKNLQKLSFGRVFKIGFMLCS